MYNKNIETTKLNTNIVYDHFIAYGGAERVCFNLKNMLHGSELYSAFVDQHKYSKNDVKSCHFQYQNNFVPTLSLILFYLFRFNLPSSILVIANGVFSPLLLCFKSYRHSIVYFHTFPSFTERRPIGSYKPNNLMFYMIGWFYKLLLRRATRKADYVFSNSKFKHY